MQIAKQTSVKTPMKTFMHIGGNTLTHKPYTPNSINKINHNARGGGERNIGKISVK
jgi:hypothetical protein